MKPTPANAGYGFLCCLSFFLMKVLASLRKRTKTGVSTWTFIHDSEMKVCYAVGGEDLKVIPATDRKHLRAIFQNFLSYGYTRKLPKLEASTPLPDDLKSDLWALEPTGA